MSIQNNIVLLKIGALLLVAGGLPVAVTGQTRNVNVVNTPNVKVVNTPTVHVGNTANVNVANTPSVQVSGTAAVAVTNNASAPVITRDADNGLTHSFQVQVTITTDANGTQIGTGAAYPFGASVIEYIDGTCDTDPNTKLYELGIDTIVGSTFALHYFVPQLVFVAGAGDLNHWVFSQPMRIYNNPLPGTDSTQLFTASGPFSAGERPPAPPSPFRVINCTVTLSGHTTNP
jgi:hypothetical protein